MMTKKRGSYWLLEFLRNNLYLYFSKKKKKESCWVQDTKVLEAIMQEWIFYPFLPSLMLWSLPLESSSLPLLVLSKHMTSSFNTWGGSWATSAVLKAISSKDKAINSVHNGWSENQTKNYPHFSSLTNIWYHWSILVVPNLIQLII